MTVKTDSLTPDCLLYKSVISKSRELRSSRKIQNLPCSIDQASRYINQWVGCNPGGWNDAGIATLRLKIKNGRNIEKANAELTETGQVSLVDTSVRAITAFWELNLGVSLLLLTLWFRHNGKLTVQMFNTIAQSVPPLQALAASYNFFFFVI